MAIQESNDDPLRTFSDKESDELTRNLVALTRKVKTIDSRTRVYSVEMVREWHAQLFAGVRDHAGRYRNKDYGEEYVQFGYYRSAPAKEVPLQLQNHERGARFLLDQLHGRSHQIDAVNALHFYENVITAGFFLHAQFIKIHPFRDGNGRVGRLIITYFLSRFGLPPLPIEVPKQEYLQALNTYHDTGAMRPLVDLALRIFNNQFGIR